MSARRIIHFTGMVSTKFGAIEEYLLEVARESRRAGYSTAIQYEVNQLPPAYRAELDAHGVDIVVCKTHDAGLQRVPRVARLLARFQPEVVQFHFCDAKTILCGSILARLIGARRVVAMVHNVHQLTRTSRARLAYNRCDWVLGVSAAVHRDLLNGGVTPARAARHYMGLLGDGRDGESRARLRHALTIPADAYVIANIAFDAPFKGVDTLIEALPHVIARCPQSYLIQAGINPERSPLPALASSLGVNDHVRWLGIRDHAHRYLAAADVYVQPSRSGEGLPLAIMEAMRAGVPTIATDVAGNAEAIVDGVSGCIVPPSDPAAIADAVVSLFQSRDLGQRFVAGASARFHEYFDGRSSVSRLLQQYYGIGQRNPPGGDTPDTPAIE